jgi:hypothetical protein
MSDWWVGLWVDGVQQEAGSACAFLQRQWRRRVGWTLWCGWLQGRGAQLACKQAGKLARRW